MAKRLLRFHELDFCVAYEQLCIEGVFFSKAAFHALCEVHSTVMRASWRFLLDTASKYSILATTTTIFYDISEDVQGFTGSGINTQSAI
jgi:hypothetical protein